MHFLQQVISINSKKVSYYSDTECLVSGLKKLSKIPYITTILLVLLFTGTGLAEKGLH